MKAPLLFLFFYAIGISLNSCQKGDIAPPFTNAGIKNPNGFVISGDGYASRLFNMNETSNNGYYDTSKHQTFIITKGDTDSIHVEIQVNFVGNAATANPHISLDTLLSPESGIVVSIAGKSNKYLYSAIIKRTFLNVSKYDAVNGKIEGAFYGRFVNQGNLSDTVSISDGRFSVLRLPDVH